jgi:hypothetical protein
LILRSVPANQFSCTKDEKTLISTQLSEAEERIRELLSMLRAEERSAAALLAASSVSVSVLLPVTQETDTVADENTSAGVPVNER